MAVIRSWSWPRGEYQSSRPRMRTSVPSVIRTPPPASVSVVFTAPLVREDSITSSEARAVRVGEREVDVARLRAREVADLAPHPDLVPEGGPQGVADGIGQLGDREGGLGDRAHGGIVEQRHGRHVRHGVRQPSPRLVAGTGGGQTDRHTRSDRAQEGLACPKPSSSPPPARPSAVPTRGASPSAAPTTWRASSSRPCSTRCRRSTRRPSRTSSSAAASPAARPATTSPAWPRSWPASPTSPA